MGYIPLPQGPLILKTEQPEVEREAVGGAISAVLRPSEESAMILTTHCGHLRPEHGGQPISLRIELLWCGLLRQPTEIE